MRDVSREPDTRAALRLGDWSRLGLPNRGHDQSFNRSILLQAGKTCFASFTCKYVFHFAEVSNKFADAAHLDEHPVDALAQAREAHEPGGSVRKRTSENEQLHARGELHWRRKQCRQTLSIAC